jgi:4'-phosphopantetheinyl transferase EntD
VAVNGAVLRDLFQPGVITAEFRGRADPSGLHPDEARLVARALTRRRVEFAAGRRCARAALAQLGLPHQVILSDRDGAPIWPHGIVGSISHTNDVAVAAVAPTGLFRSIGLDVETLGAVEPALWPTILTGGERVLIAAVAPELQPRAATLYFAAKEAVYKCQYPLTGEWLDFHDVEIEIEGDVFEAAVTRNDLKLARYGPLKGAFRLVCDVMVAAVALPADG